jgi:hypothetical protein
MPVCGLYPCAHEVEHIETFQYINTSPCHQNKPYISPTINANPKTIQTLNKHTKCLKSHTLCKISHMQHTRQYKRINPNAHTNMQMYNLSCLACLVCFSLSVYCKGITSSTGLHLLYLFSCSSLFLIWIIDKSVCGTVSTFGKA